MMMMISARQGLQIRGDQAPSAAWQQPLSGQGPSASSMMRRIVLAQRPHCGLHPRQP
jgi:hypothetical protein